MRKFIIKPVASQDQTLPRFPFRLFRPPAKRDALFVLKVLNSILELGLVEPLDVLVHEDSIEVVDGHSRLTAIGQLISSGCRDCWGQVWRMDSGVPVHVVETEV